MTESKWFFEHFDTAGTAFGLRLKRKVEEVQTQYQHIEMWETDTFGYLMTIDGCTMVTSRDNFLYHEMMSHPALFAHANPKNVGIIGGGACGTLREVLKHQEVEHVTQVEIDQAVIDMSTQYLPNHSQGAYANPRATIVIGDGMDFVRNSDEKFDVIISDSTDPIGPGEVLFSEDFYALAKARLTEGGIIATQNGVPFFQQDDLINTHKRLGMHFSDTTFYSAAIPTYYGGIMTLAWGTENIDLRQTPLATLEQRFQAAGIKTRYYNPAIHQAAFALPQYLLDTLATG